MVRQHAIAVKNDFTFLRSAAQVHEYVQAGRLVPLADNALYRLSAVSFPYARPTTKLFVERLAAEYRAATGTPLVITSLTRPLALQPTNASPLSVHPAGMAVDLRVPAKDGDREWLESTLLSLEARGLVDVTREHHPSHFHVAVFPEKYASYAATHPLPDSLIAPPPRVGVATPHATIATPARSEPPNRNGGELLVTSAALAALIGTVIGLRRRLDIVTVS